MHPASRWVDLDSTLAYGGFVCLPRKCFSQLQRGLRTDPANSPKHSKQRSRASLVVEGLRSVGPSAWPFPGKLPEGTLIVKQFLPARLPHQKTTCAPHHSLYISIQPQRLSTIWQHRGEPEAKRVWEALLLEQVCVFCKVVNTMHHENFKM